MPKYVRRYGSDRWHWCKNCSRYPSESEIAETTYSRPTTDLCNECKAKEREKNCRT